MNALINFYSNWRFTMYNYYRGSRVGSQKEEKVTDKKGVYRGVKHEGTTEEASKSKKGVYRGVKWDGRS